MRAFDTAAEHCLARTQKSMNFWPKKRLFRPKIGGVVKMVRTFLSAWSLANDWRLLPEQHQANNPWIRGDHPASSGDFARSTDRVGW